MAVKYASTSPDPLAILNDMSAAELTALMKAAERKRDEKLTQAKSELIDEMKERAGQLGLSLEDLLPLGRESKGEQTPEKTARSPSVETHRLPSGATKKGRGKASRAYLEELQQLKSEGRSEDEFLIEKRS